MKKGIIYLIPSVISPDTAPNVLPQQILAVVKNTHYFLAETIRESRRFISSLKLDIDISLLQFELSRPEDRLLGFRAAKCRHPHLCSN